MKVLTKIWETIKNLLSRKSGIWSKFIDATRIAVQLTDILKIAVESKGFEWLSSKLSNQFGEKITRLVCVVGHKIAVIHGLVTEFDTIEDGFKALFDFLIRSTKEQRRTIWIEFAAECACYQESGISFTEAVAGTQAEYAEKAG